MKKVSLCIIIVWPSQVHKNNQKHRKLAEDALLNFCNLRILLTEGSSCHQGLSILLRMKPNAHNCLTTWLTKQQFKSYRSQAEHNTMALAKQKLKQLPPKDREYWQQDWFRNEQASLIHRNPCKSWEQTNEYKYCQNFETHKQLHLLGLIQEERSHLKNNNFIRKVSSYKISVIMMLKLKRQ